VKVGNDFAWKIKAHHSSMLPEESSNGGGGSKKRKPKPKPHAHKASKVL
jgi:hypothetical protein